MSPCRWPVLRWTQIKSTSKHVAQSTMTSKIGSEETNNVLSVGQRVCWVKDKTGQLLCVANKRRLAEHCAIEFYIRLAYAELSGSAMHSQSQSVLGQGGWPQSWAQYQACCRCVHAARLRLMHLHIEMSER